MVALSRRRPARVDRPPPPSPNPGQSKRRLPKRVQRPKKKTLGKMEVDEQDAHNTGTTEVLPNDTAATTESPAVASPAGDTPQE